MKYSPHHLGTSEQRRVAFELLVACARNHDDAHIRNLLDRTTSVAVVRLSDYHGVGGFVYERLRAIDPQSSIVAELHAGFESAVRNHLLALWELRRLQPRLDEAGLRWAVVKGPAVVETLHRASPGRRSYFDVDLLVEPAQFVQAIRTLERFGARVLDKNWKLLHDEMRGDVHLLLPAGVPLDLHWDLIRKDRGPMHVRTGDVLSRSDRIAVGDAPIPILAGTDALLHLALDAALAGGDRLMPLKDIAEASNQWRPDWDVIAYRAKEWNVEAPVGLILARAQRVLDADVPSHLIRRLLDRRVRRVLRLVDQVSPWPFALGRDLAPTRLFAAAAGRGLVGGTFWAARRVGLVAAPWRPVDESAFVPRGSHAHRDAFMDRATRGGV